MRSLTLRGGLVLIVIAALVPIGALTVVQALSTLRYSRSLIGNQLVTSALATAGHEGDPLIIARQVLFTLSANPQVRTAGPGCHEALKSGFGTSPALLVFARFDASGQILCSSTPLDWPISAASEKWWQRGIQSGSFSVSGVIMAPVLQKRVIVAMQPIIAANGAKDGLITATIDASRLEQSLVTSGVRRNAAVAIVNGSGDVVLTHEGRSLPHFDVNAGNAKVAYAKTREGTRWMYAAAPLYERELFVVYAEPVDQLMATSVRQVRINLILPLVALVMASLAIWLGTTRLVLRWLDALRRLANEFARGDFAGQPGIFEKSPHEIRVLSDDLHRMGSAIAANGGALQAALDAKTALTRDIHHRVKNNLQIVSSLLNLQASKISDPAAREALNQTRARIGALAQIHRLLYEESHDSDHGNVNISSLMEALCSQLRTLHRGQTSVHLDCDVAPQKVPINSAVPLTLFAVEAVTNAYRHAFPGGRAGTVTIRFEVNGDVASLAICDNGTGYDATSDASSMGRQLMRAFAQQLGGEKSVTSTPQGTTVFLRYPFEPNIDE
ncbi:MAG: histidine kinase dimerization/phosphoacceptor domain -containing protein [Novosphingobium sp.]